MNVVNWAIRHARNDLISQLYQVFSGGLHRKEVDHCTEGENIIHAEVQYNKT